MPRLYVQLLTPQDPALEDVPGSSATIYFPTPLHQLITIQNLLEYLTAVPQASYNLVHAIQILQLQSLNQQNSPEKPTHPPAKPG